jgi:2-polyprenyl-3-methyl-5-hydroxy-6-metoxy-1,4-benzoquinol methylase
MNQEKIDHLAERILSETNSAMICIVLYIGHKLNLFNYLKDSSPITSVELANRTKYSERYLREWLECMTVHGYIEYNALTKKFRLPEEHAVVFCDYNNIAYTIPFVYWIPSLALITDKLINAFQTDEGVPYSDYGANLIFAQGEGNRPMFVNDITKWIAAMPDIENKLKSEGGYILDVGCGDGWASISLAKNFPLIEIDAVDPDLTSIENAKRNISEAGLSDRISLYNLPIEKLVGNNKYDLAMTFESIHDMPYPIESLRKIKERLSNQGIVLVADVKMQETIEKKNDFVGQLYYNFSVLLCLPQSMAYSNSKATGAAMTPSTFKRYSREAGFSKIEVLPIDHFMWNFYKLIP